MKKMVKVTIRDFTKIKENLNDANELALYEQANGHTYEAEIEHDGYAVIDLPDGEYIELAIDEYELIIEDWKVAGKIGAATLVTKSDPNDETAMLYRLQDERGEVVQAEQSLSKEVVRQLAQAWFAKQPKKEE
ncbi:hypothetical protein ACQCN2_17000 [Brevibacillus ginsengisoli]|uniref:hypothetical protein n=1 Tax=Brevibacillus ginsengisoli TaxID=363854 RepID=UPI003CF936A2